MVWWGNGFVLIWWLLVVGAAPNYRVPVVRFPGCRVRVSWLLHVKLAELRHQL